MKKIFFTILFLFASSWAQAQELDLVGQKIYLMNFNSEIINLHTNENQVDAQILHSIFNDKKQIILSLKEGNSAILQVKTEDKLYNYNLNKSDKSSKELIEIDIPPFENLDVDIYEGK